MTKSPMNSTNVVIETKEALTAEEKRLFAYFGEGVKISPPMRIVNPHRISIGDRTSIQAYSHIAAYQDLRFLREYIVEEFKKDFPEQAYLYDSSITIGKANLIGRFFFMGCTNSITLEDNVLLSERVFIGDHNHSHFHHAVPIMQQPNQQGKPVRIGRGSWVGAGASILKGAQIGCFSVVGTNSVCSGSFPDYAVIGPAPATLLYTINPD